LPNAEELQRGHDADEPDDEFGDRAELVTNGFFRRPRDVPLKRGGAVDRFLKDPFDCARHDPGSNQDDDCDEDFRTPINELGLPISALVVHG